jgi:hypothetical protein
MGHLLGCVKSFSIAIVAINGSQFNGKSTRNQGRRPKIFLAQFGLQGARETGIFR